MATRKSTIAISVSNLNQYSENAARAVSATFYACWLDYHEAYPERFTPEAVLFN